MTELEFISSQSYTQSFAMPAIKSLSSNSVILVCLMYYSSINSPVFFFRKLPATASFLDHFQKPKKKPKKKNLGFLSPLDCKFHEKKLNFEQKAEKIAFLSKITSGSDSDRLSKHRSLPSTPQKLHSC